MADYTIFNLKALKARAKWLEKVIAIREGAARDSLIAEREAVLAEISKREAAEQ